jgi:3-oxoadipate enol-lactonase
MSLPQYSRIMAETMANGTYVEISGAAHISNVDSSDAFNAHMLAFLRDGRAIPPDKPLHLRQGRRFRRKIAGRPR